jgi:hypothetical protein
VLELILEHGSDVHKQKIAETIRRNVFQYAKNRFASYVVEKAIIICKAPDVHAMASELLKDHERFLVLAVHECGTHVVKAVLKSPVAPRDEAKDLISENAEKLRASKYGKRLLEEM